MLRHFISGIESAGDNCYIAGITGEQPCHDRLILSWTWVIANSTSVCCHLVAGRRGAKHARAHEDFRANRLQNLFPLLSDLKIFSISSTLSN